MGELTSAQVNTLTSTELQSFSTTQAKGLTAAQIGGLDHDRGRQLHLDSSFGALSNAQLDALTTTNAARRSARPRSPAWSSTQVGGLTTAQVSNLTTTQVEQPLDHSDRRL